MNRGDKVRIPRELRTFLLLIRKALRRWFENQSEK